MNHYRLRGVGPLLAAFGLGFAAAQILPCSLLPVLTAAVLICTGAALCRY